VPRKVLGEKRITYSSSLKRFRLRYFIQSARPTLRMGESHSPGEKGDFNSREHQPSNMNMGKERRIIICVTMKGEVWEELRRLTSHREGREEEESVESLSP